ncbi:MAG TPA: hypothetical protein VJA47_06090, partial [archaeon]|nr:hypothetical protein [archaeon]
GFAAVYIKQQGEVPVPQTFVIGDSFTLSGLGSITSEVLENPLYTSTILDNIAKSPVGTPLTSLVAGTALGAPIGVMLSMCLDYYFGIEHTGRFTIPVFGISTAIGYASIQDVDRESWLTRARDRWVSRRLSGDVESYRYGPHAEAEILAEDIVIREELRKAALFKRWREMEIGDNKQPFLEFYKEFKKGDDENIRRARKVFDAGTGTRADERFGKAVLVFSEHVEEAEDE